MSSSSQQHHTTSFHPCHFFSIFQKNNFLVVVLLLAGIDLLLDFFLGKVRVIMGVVIGLLHTVTHCWITSRHISRQGMQHWIALTLVLEEKRKTT
jgi:hypothetical protein